jgi:hypothetical protein
MSLVVSEYRGDWTSLVQYYAGDIIRHQGAVWLLLAKTLNQPPPDVDLYTQLGPSATSTSGVGTTPSSSSTTTVTHNLGRNPIVIRIYGLGQKQSSGSASNDVTSIGMWTTSGNTCINRVQGASGGQASSTAFAIKVGSGATAFVSGVIENVTDTTFDITWTESGSSNTTPVYLWEAC